MEIPNVVQPGISRCIYISGMERNHCVCGAEHVPTYVGGCMCGGCANSKHPVEIAIFCNFFNNNSNVAYVSLLRVLPRLITHIRKSFFFMIPLLKPSMMKRQQQQQQHVRSN